MVEAGNRVPGAPSNRVRAVAEAARPAPGAPRIKNPPRTKPLKNRNPRNKNPLRNLSRSQVPAAEAPVAEVAPRVPVVPKTSSWLQYPGGRRYSKTSAARSSR